MWKQGRISWLILACLGLSSNSRALADWSYRDWKPGGQRITLDGLTFDSTIHCGNGHDFVKVGDLHYRFRTRVAQRRYAWRFYFKIECPESMIGKTITLEAADLNHGGRQLWQEAANAYSEDGETWLPVGLENTTLVPWTPTAHAAEERAYGDAGHVPYGVQFRLKLTGPVMWFAGPAPYTLDRRDRLFEQIKQDHPEYVEISKVGDSRHSSKHGYPITMVRITGPGDASRRQNIVIIAGEHCSEVAGIYACEGWLKETLMQPDWLKRYVFHFIPIVNVDGLYYGATYYNMPPNLTEGWGVNLSPNWQARSEPEIQALWKLVTTLRPVLFASLHNGRHRKTMDVFGADNAANQAMLTAWRNEVGFTIEPLRTSHTEKGYAWDVLSRQGIVTRGYTIETLLLERLKGHKTFQTSYTELGRQLARGAVRGLAAPSEPEMPKQPTRLRFDADRFTAQLPWFYHGLPFDTHREHSIHSFEVNGLGLASGEYTVALTPRESTESLAVSFDGLTFKEVPVRQGRAELHDVGIRNRMLSLYVKGKPAGSPLATVWVYPPETTFAEANKSAPEFKAYRRNIKIDEREILQPDNWKEFSEILHRRSFGKRELRSMFDKIVTWCKRQQVLDEDDLHYGAIYSEEDKYDFRDAAAAAVCFTRVWRETGEEDYRRRALLARNYAHKGQILDDPTNKDRYGAYTQMIHGAWGPGMQRLRADGTLPDATGVETAVIVNLVIKTFELGLEPSDEDLEHLRAAAVWMMNNEPAPGLFRHHQGATHDCQNTNVMGAEALVRAYHALEQSGRKPPREWLVAARRGMEHFIEGQEAIGCWPYVFAKIGRGQAFSEQNLPDQGMGFYHFSVACDTPTFRDTPGTKEAMRRAARWWLCMSRIDDSGPLPTINLDDRQARGGLKFSKFTWCRFMAAASLMRIAEQTGETYPWRDLALCYMEHVNLKLANTTDPDKPPFRRATSDDMTLCSWIQAIEWAGVLLTEIEQRLERLPTE